MEFLFEEWQDQWIPELKERQIDLGLPNVRKILTFAGIRRGGKTFSMYQFIKHLSKDIPRESIFYINFEDERIVRRKETLTELIPTLLRMYGDGDRSIYLFLDEIQSMPEWGRWLRRVYDGYRNILFFVSGSSSHLSSKELPTELRGRALTIEVLPLSFKELLSFRGVPLENKIAHNERKVAHIKSELKEYIEQGGFPEVVLESSVVQKRRLVQEYYRTIITRDIAERNRIKNPMLLGDFLKLLLNSTEFTANKTVAVLRSQGHTAGKETILKYSKYIEDSYLAIFVPIFSYKIKDMMRYPKKVYFTDNAFLTHISVKFSADHGRMYENAVAVELRRKQAANPLMEIYYWKDRNGKTVDFVVKEGLKATQLIQVCYDIGDYDTKKRETSALVKASAELKCRDLLVITDGYDGVERIDGRGMKFVPLWKWLLE